MTGALLGPALFAALLAAGKISVAVQKPAAGKGIDANAAGKVLSLKKVRDELIGSNRKKVR